MQAERKTIKINGTDFTSYVPDVGYSVKNVPVYGGNAMTMQTGGKFKDEIANLSEVTMPTLPLTETQVKTLTTTLLAGQTVSLYFYDPDIEDYRVIVANRTFGGKKKYRGMGADGNLYWTGFEVVFEEIP